MHLPMSLTLRTVEHGENLPYLCHQIYGDASLYLEVARSNGLTNVRALSAGDQLLFPPLEK